MAISSPTAFCKQLHADSSTPTIEILDTRVISWQTPVYHGWPTLARRSNGELLVVFSGGREKHVCTFGRVEWMRSKDTNDGKSGDLGYPSTVERI
jgi:hypothetical protein